MNNKKVNILYSMICRDFHDAVINKIRKSIDIGNEIGIVEMYNGNLKHFNNTYECCDVYYGQYYKYKEYKVCPPIDDNIINKMNPYALEILKMMDRKQSWDMVFEDRMQIYLEHIRFWNFILDHYEINRVVFFNIPHEVVDYVIYCLCKIKNIKMSILNGSTPFADRCIIFNDIDNIGSGLDKLIENYKESYKDVDIADIPMDSNCRKIYERYALITKEKDLSKMLEKRTWKGASQKVMINYMVYMDIRHMIEKRFKGKTDGILVSKELKRYLEGDKSIYKKPFLIKNILRTKEIRNYYERIAEIPPKGEKYFLFSMHYQPEATTSPLAGGIYSNQVIAIELLAKNLPKDVKLYVKEHPNQIYVGRTKSLYDRIKRIKNVRLISERVNQYELIKECIATSTINGTVVLESLILDKPCIMMGKYLYRYVDGVYQVRKNEECQIAIKEILNGNTRIDQKNIKIFFKALYDYSKPANVGYGDYNKKINAKNMSTILIDDINIDN